MQSKIELNSEQEKLRDLIEETQEHVFITGKAGTGKSTLLEAIKASSKKQLVIVAPTGVAALNIGAQTIHSLFGIPPNFIDKSKLKIKQTTRKLLKSIDTVIIDEISMVRADLMDAIDHILKDARSSSKAFGGVQLVMFGDLYQLPPVISDPNLKAYFQEYYNGFYFFNAHVWQETDLSIYELDKIYRQENDEDFKYILNSIRIREFDSAVLNMLNERAKIPAPETGTITLAMTNSAVQSINLKHLNELKTKSFAFDATVTGSLEPSAYPTEKTLELKVGAQVMFLKNDREKRWVNGSIGIVDYLDKDSVEVNINGEIVSVKKEKWDKIRYYHDPDSQSVKEESVSSFKQFPLRLAWAITVHKSQGQTLDSVIFDIGSGAFAHGQTYVALSRCRSLEGLYLKREIKARDIIVDPAVLDFMRKARVCRV